MSIVVGVDIGGTFTDVVASDGRRTWVEKIRSTPDDPCAAITDAVKLLADRGLPHEQVGAVAHGTTVATNAILEGSGARTALVTTKGFRDVLEIGRLRVPQLYDLLWTKPRPLVPRALRVEVGERVAADGTELQPLDEEALARAVERLRERDVESVAVCFVNSFADPSHEQRAVELLRASLPGVSLSCSSEVLPEIKEYERTSTTVVDAYIKPRVASYLGQLRDELAGQAVDAPLLIMQSNGGLTTPDLATQFPVTVIESGPAAGLLAAARLSASLGLPRALSFDMGGTTAKAALIEDGVPRLSSYYEVGGGENVPAGNVFRGSGYPISVPSLEISEVGAGGGSIAWVDTGGVLKVGPHSAGADPGPACYGKGGELPTVTDADVVLGLVDPAGLSDQSLPTDRERSFEAIRDHLCQPLGVDVHAAARAVVDIANAQMMRALRSVTVEKGKDPTTCALIAFGGAGPVHAAGVAERIGISTVVVPPMPGLYSALGLLAADIQVTTSHSLAAALDTSGVPVLERAAAAARAELSQRLGEGGVGAGAEAFRHVAEVRLPGQSHALMVDLRSPVTPGELERVRDAFAALYAETYRYDVAGQPAEVTKLITTLSRPNPQRDLVTSIAQSLEARRRSGGAATRETRWEGGAGASSTPVVARGDLAEAAEGPLLVEEYDTVVVVPPGWRARVDGQHNIVLTRSEQP